MALVWDDSTQQWIDDGTTGPDGSTLNNGVYTNLPGQLNNFPGGYSSNGTVWTSDPTGTGAVYNDPSINPNPTGGWQNIAASILGLASGAFKAFNQGSPSVGVPPPLYPTGWSTRPPVNPPVTIGGSQGTILGMQPSTLALIAAGIAIAFILVNH